MLNKMATENNNVQDKQLGLLNNEDQLKITQEVITESAQYVPDAKQTIEQPSVIIDRRNSRLNDFTHSLESNWVKFINSFKKHLSMMIIFILIGGTLGLYVAKFIYDFRMNEICRVGGFVHNNTVYDVKLRP